MRILSREEQVLFDEMKERCLAKGQYKDEKAKDKFKMLCHLEDFMIQYWELLKENESLKKENKILRENAENNDKVVDKINWENQLLKKENKQLENCYCNRTDCSGRIKDSKQYDSLVQKVENQQKEFIKYLEDLIKQNETVVEVSKYGLPKNCSKLLIDFYKEILTKYKEIIGDDKECFG